MKRFTATILTVLCLCLICIPLGSAALAAGSPSAGQITTQSAPLNVRSSSTTSSAVIGSLPRGSYVTLLDKDGSWWHVQLSGGATGYCYASYITQVSNSEAMVISTQWSPLNIRSGPSTSYSILTRLAKGTTVVKLSESNNFAHILYNGTSLGYASLNYLSETGSAASTAGTYTAVSLSMPSYKQTDSRWASVAVGSSGRTIADIGCATTCLAMTDSYRLGTSITPDVMEDRLHYTAGGAVYWPTSTYTVGGAMSLSELYAKLKAGNPVIIGAKNPYGGTHFVVVTGYTGGSTLRSSGFTINDPGSNSRTTLSAFLSAYPNIYRSVYAK